MKIQTPWDNYPRFLCWEEIKDPIIFIAHFFDSGDVASHRRDLKMWLDCVITKKVFNYNHQGPGYLLFVYEYNARLIEATYLLYLEARSSYIKKKYNSDDVAAEKASWRFYPANLSADEQVDPFLALKKIFKTYEQQEYRNMLNLWFETALYKMPIDEVYEPREVINLYRGLKKLYSVAWILHERHFNKSLGNDKILAQVDLAEPKKYDEELKRSPNELKAQNLASVSFKDNLEPEIEDFKYFKELFRPKVRNADKVSLDKVSKIITDRLESVEMIVHIGTNLNPLIYYMVILIADNEKREDGELSNKLEDNCRHLGDIYAIVHKSSIVRTAVAENSRFWNLAIERGNILYRSEKLQDIQVTPIVNVELAQKATFHWDRWGKQALDFLSGAEHYNTNDNYRLAAFSLHQAAESTLKAIIQSVLGYRVQMHSLSRLLKLSLLISQELRDIYALNTVKGVQEFTLLRNAYSQSRYSTSFDPEKADIENLAVTVDDAWAIAASIYKNFISFLEKDIVS